MQSSAPVIIDLDGTLIKTDTLLESILLLLKKNPLWIFMLPFWLLKGKASLKNNIAAKVDLPAQFLPYNDDVLQYIKIAKREGHSCYLATGASKKIADLVAKHLGLFDDVFATGEKNLTGKDKVALLDERFGKGNYIYVGNEKVDLAVWKNAAEAIVVSADDALVADARKINACVKHIEIVRVGVKDYLKALRVHQWVKNALLFVPLLTSHNLGNADLIALCLLGFLSYSFAASSVYVLNDLMDLESDRQHKSKRKRPFAAGVIPITHGLFIFPALLIIAFVIALLFLPIKFVFALLVYYVATLLYSFKLKRIIMLDTIMLAGLYTMRIIAGTVLINVRFSFWLLAFSMFIFLSLALVKRYTELVLLRSEGAKKTIGRGYHADDASMVASLGGASGYIAVTIFALYVNSAEVAQLYTSPHVLWLACPILLYWISRVWIIAHRGEMNDDPIVFAVKDFQSFITGLIVLAVFAAAV